MTRPRRRSSPSRCGRSGRAPGTGRSHRNGGRRAGSADPRLPDQCVSHNDRGGIRDGPPVGGEVDDRWRQLVIEEHVSGEVAVDQLARGRSPVAEGSSELRQVRNGREFAGGDLVPGNPICHGPGISSAVQERWPLHVAQSSVEPVTRGDDVRASLCRLWLPDTNSVALQPSTHRGPSAAGRGRARRNPSWETCENTRTCHARSPGSAVAGFRTRSPARHDVPLPAVQ